MDSSLPPPAPVMMMVVTEYGRRLAYSVADGQPGGGTAAQAAVDQNEAMWNQKAVVIVGTLLFFIIFTLALIPVAKCILRVAGVEPAPGLRLVEPGAAASATAPAAGLKHRVLQSFPTFTFKRPPAAATSDLPPSVATSAPYAFASPDCPICLAQFSEGEKLRLLPSCLHGFHVDCIDTWLLAHSSCPICRQSLFGQA